MKTQHGGTIRDEGPTNDVSGGKSVRHRADASCFERVTIRNDFRPECAECDRKAFGGKLIGEDTDMPTFLFLCDVCGPPPRGWATIVENMTRWIPVEKIEKGMYRMRIKPAVKKEIRGEQ